MSNYPAGPSRSYTPPLPPPVPPKTSSPSLSPSFSSSHSVDRPAPGGGWANGNGTTEIPDAAEGSRRNPLVDLIDSEKLYVEQLGLVIRRVAGAWSRKDFPPPKLDGMFRCVESVYRANRSFGTKLKEIGPNPSSPKALGDLLMRWIDDLEPAYRKYCTTYLAGFDSYPPVSRNVLLPGILTDISTSTPPTPPLEQWSLDALFLLPYTRLRYYRKLYARLLRSTKEGRSDHRLLLVANQRLEALVSDVEARLEMDVAEEETATASVSAPGSTGDRSRETSWLDKERVSRTSSAMDSSLESHSNSRTEDPRNSAGSAATSFNQSPQRRPTVTVPALTPTSKASPVSAPMPTSDLELRIDPERTIDLFSMNPKKCKLQMNPPSLPYHRALRSSFDVTVQFTPSSTGQPVVHRRAHIFILSDLFLVAEWMDASDKAAKAVQVAKEQPERVGQGGPMPEMWLCYPPLAGKHLMVAEGSQANVLTVMILRKETFVIHAESDVARDQIMKDLIDCIDFATNLSRRNTNTAPSASSPAGPDARSPSSLSDARSHESTFPPLRYPSPFSASSSPATSPRPSDASEFHPPAALGGNALVSQMTKMSLEPGDTVSWQRGPSPPPQLPTVPVQSMGGSTVAALPPRGASLRSRPSINATSPPLGPGAPQLPSLSFGSDSSLANAHGGAPGAPLPRSASGRSVQSAPRPPEHDIPPVPVIRAAGSHMSDSAPSVPSYTPLHGMGPSRSRSAEPLRPIDPLAPPRPGGLAPQPPSARFSSFPHQSDPDDDASPPASPTEEEAATLTGPAVISAQMKCKVFLQQGHAQWKSLGAGKLKLYAQKSGNVKQLVVESDSGSKAMLISTIVLTDGVERVAKTGVAVEISDKGRRTGIIYMIQLRNETSAAGLFESLLAGSDRAVGR
ncbi:hypothetical protein EHS25_001653 [Saitozyma podzolica]|uniref:DH domain-containing protein n=1 Tax=Saitozyma podzolica TaxID=1890683 RepID=A0A427YGN9_9TREE|nr:hypothetical protein EHS25_001653 [Saitozyma podzolica]